MPSQHHRNGSKRPTSLEFVDGHPRSTRTHDPPEFVERVQAESLRKFGASIEDLISDPDLREIAYTVLADLLRNPRDPGPVPDDIQRVVDRMAEVGITVTPGSYGPRYFPEPMNIGISLSDAVLEERYGVGGLDRE